MVPESLQINSEGRASLPCPLPASPRRLLGPWVQAGLWQLPFPVEGRGPAAPSASCLRWHLCQRWVAASLRSPSNPWPLGGGRVKGGNFSGSSRHMAPAGLAGDRGWQKGPPVPFPAEPPRSPPAANGAGAGITLGPGMGLCQPCQPSVTQGDGSKRTHGQGQTSSLPHGRTSSSGSSFLCRAPLTSAASRGDVGWPRARKGNRRLPALLKRSPTTFLLCVAAGSLAFPGCQRSWRIKPRAPTAAAARPR